MKEHTGKNKIFIVIIICLCAVIIAGLIYFMKLKGGSDSAFKPDLDSNAKTQTAPGKSRQESGYRAIRPLRSRQTKKTCR
jgi:uncharacterized protein YxeA